MTIAGLKLSQSNGTGTSSVTVSPRVDRRRQVQRADVQRDGHSDLSVDDSRWRALSGRDGYPKGNEIVLHRMVDQPRSRITVTKSGPLWLAGSPAGEFDVAVAGVAGVVPEMTAVSLAVRLFTSRCSTGAERKPGKKNFH